MKDENPMQYKDYLNPIETNTLIAPIGTQRKPWPPQSERFHKIKICSRAKPMMKNCQGFVLVALGTSPLVVEGMAGVAFFTNEDAPLKLRRTR
jgi:hypothetical protein